MSVTVRSAPPVIVRSVSVRWVRPRGRPRRVTVSASPSSSVTAAKKGETASPGEKMRFPGVRIRGGRFPSLLSETRTVMVKPAAAGGFTPSSALMVTRWGFTSASSATTPRTAPLRYASPAGRPETATATRSRSGSVTEMGRAAMLSPRL